MNWIDQIPTEAWGALGTIITGFWGLVVFAIRQWLKRREIQTKADFDRKSFEDTLERQRAELAQHRAEWALKKDQHETEALRTALQLLTTTLTDISNQMKQQARQAQLQVESGQITIELLKSQGEKALAVHSAIRSEHQQTRDQVKQGTDSITAAVEQLRSEVAAAGLDSLKADIDVLLTKVLSASKIKIGDAPTDQNAAGEETIDPSAKKGGDGMATISIPAVALSQKKASEAKE